MPALRYLDDALAPTLLPPVDERVRACAGALSALVDKAGPDGPGRADLPPKVQVAVGRGEAFAHAMPAAVRIGEHRLVGMKWISGDPRRPPPTIGGLILLEDPEAGGLRGLVAAAGLTGARTAAVSMVGLQAAPPRTARAAAGEPWRVTFVGGGVQAFSHREALAAVAPEARVRFVTRRSVGELPLRDGDEASRPEHLGEAVRGADVVITSVAFGTPEREIDPALLEPGATVVATDYATAVTAATIGGVRGHGDAPGMPRLIVDDAEQFDATRASGKLPGYGPADATLGRLLTDPDGLGRAVRERPVGSTVVVNHLGVAVCDLAIGWAVLRAAEERGAGTELRR
jgi:ornithine cyclodeaminase/alanine dehydrogenase-like protein (mu-crystallin family)